MSAAVSDFVTEFADAYALLAEHRDADTVPLVLLCLWLNVDVETVQAGIGPLLDSGEFELCDFDRDDPIIQAGSVTRCGRTWAWIARKR